jgi:hypothetical protein
MTKKIFAVTNRASLISNLRGHSPAAVIIGISTVQRKGTGSRFGRYPSRWRFIYIAVTYSVYTPNFQNTRTYGFSHIQILLFATELSIKTTVTVNLNPSARDVLDNDRWLNLLINTYIRIVKDVLHVFTQLANNTVMTCYFEINSYTALLFLLPFFFFFFLVLRN